MVFIFKNGVKTVFYFLTTSEKHIIISLPDARVSFFDTSLSEKKNEISLPLLKKKIDYFLSPVNREPMQLLTVTLQNGCLEKFLKIVTITIFDRFLFYLTCGLLDFYCFSEIDLFL